MSQPTGAILPVCMKCRKLTSFYVFTLLLFNNGIVLNFSSDTFKATSNSITIFAVRFNAEIQEETQQLYLPILLLSRFPSQCSRVLSFIVSIWFKELALAILLGVGLLATNFLPFPSSLNILISPALLKNIFTGHRILG